MRQVACSKTLSEGETKGGWPVSHLKKFQQGPHAGLEAQYLVVGQSCLLSLRNRPPGASILGLLQAWVNATTGVVAPA